MLLPKHSALTQHLALERDQTVLPVLPIWLVTARRTVPVEELEVALQYGLDLHLSLRGAAGVQQVDHGRQALQGQSREPHVLGLRGGPTAPGPQNREQILNRLRSDREESILLKRQRWQPVINANWQMWCLLRVWGNHWRGADLSSTDDCTLEVNQPECERLWDRLTLL